MGGLILVYIIALIWAAALAGKREKQAVKNAVEYETDRTFNSSEWATDADRKGYADL